jgi:hypothetical protein
MAARAYLIHTLKCAEREPAPSCLLKLSASDSDSGRGAGESAIVSQRGGVKTNIVTSVEISGAHAGDSPYFRPLVEQTSKNFVMQEVSADKAYSSSKNLQLVLVKQAMPYIDFKVNANATDKRQSATWKRMYNFYQYNQESFMRSYHKRSNVESTFSMIKAKLGNAYALRRRRRRRMKCSVKSCVTISVASFNLSVS